MLGVLVLMAILGPVLSPYAPGDLVGDPFSPPSAAHLLGTNDVGQDLLAELFAGAQVSLAVGLLAAAVATTVGTVVGLLAGYHRGWTDNVAMRVTDVVLCLPVLPTALVLGAFLGAGVGTEVVVIAVLTWGPAARELRSQVLTVRERDHIQALRAMGAGTAYVLSRHLWRDLVSLIVPQFVLAAKMAILLEATLSFLGLGDARARSWGATLSFAQARSVVLTDAWLWWVVPPGLCIAAAILGFALLGYGIEERGRPRLQTVTVSRSRTPRAAPRDVEPGAPALEIDDLAVGYDTPAGPITAVDGVSLAVRRGQVLGIVGESGSGKTTLVLAATGLLRPPGRVVRGTARIAGVTLNTADPSDTETGRRLRGDRVGIVPQDAIDALNPVQRVGPQIAEAITVHHRIDRDAARARVADLLETVGLAPDCARRYPHQLSGGMRQRVVLAMAVANNPDLLVADEPTSGLDVLGQVEILDVLAQLRTRLGLAVVIVSHDLDVVLGTADRVLVMRYGRVVEQGTALDLGDAPQHPYTRALLAATPRLRVP